MCALALGVAAPALAQTCTFNSGQPSSASFGAIDPTRTTPATFSVTLNFKCPSSVNATFIITGANDTGPGQYRVRNNTTVLQYMPYTITSTIIPGTKVMLDGRIDPSGYQNAYVGGYTDTLTVLILP